MVIIYIYLKKNINFSLKYKIVSKLVKKIKIFNKKIKNIYIYII